MNTSLHTKANKKNYQKENSDHKISPSQRDHDPEGSIVKMQSILFVTCLLDLRLHHQLRFVEEHFILSFTSASAVNYSTWHSQGHKDVLTRCWRLSLPTLSGRTSRKYKAINVRFRINRQRGCACLRRNGKTKRAEIDRDFRAESSPDSYCLQLQIGKRCKSVRRQSCH